MIDIGTAKEDLNISFGSCYGIYDFQSDIFETIAAEKPDLFIWLGDVSYNDSPDLKFHGMSEEYVSKRLALTKSAKGYSKLSRVIGVWDDHDFGTNDGDRLFEHKKRNRVAFLDFIDEPADSERRL